MADNFLERHHEDYEARKAAWLHKKYKRRLLKRIIQRPEDETL